MTSTKKIRNINGISEIQYLTINNTQQYVLIRGENVKNPILLFLHGGPGASATTMLRKFNSDLEKHFTIVYWDQRNAGKSYDKKFPKEEIKVQKYIQDVDVLVAYLKDRLRAEKIFLVGHSWGSRLGMYAIQEYPENFIAYLGVAQELSSYEGELISYQYTLNKAKELNNVKAITELEEMGEPQSGDYSKMYKNGIRDFWKQKNWIINNNHKFIESKWWKIERYECTLVKRDRNWWLRTMEEIQKFWEEVEYYKINDKTDIINRINNSKKRKFKKEPDEIITTDKCLL